MTRPGLPSTLLLLASLLAPTATTWAQDLDGGDPRNVEDPRRTSDPRRGNDPREETEKPGIEEAMEPLQGAELFEELYRGGNTGALSSAMAGSPWELTNYIDDLCTQWITMTRDKDGKPVAPTAESKALETKVREIARLADAGIGDTRFGFWVGTIFSMTPEQRVMREEQVKLLAQGERILESVPLKQETYRALTPLRQSLSRAQQLNDFLGQSRAHSLIGRVQLLNRSGAEARASGREAIRIGRSLRDMRSVWNGWATVMIASARLRDFQTAKDALTEQHNLAIAIGDEITADAILDQIIELERALGTVRDGTLIIYGRRLDQPRRRLDNPRRNF